MATRNGSFGEKYDEKKKVWIVQYSKRNPETRQAVTLRRQVKTKAKIRAVYNDLVGAVERKLARKQIPTWESLVGSYLVTCKDRNISEKTIYNIDKCLRAKTFALWGSRLVNEVTSHDIRELIEVFYADRSPSHQKSMLKFVRQVMEHGFERGYLDRNPTPKLTFKIGDKIKKALTEEQVRLLLNAAKEFDSPWYPLWTTALYTGMRNGELYAMTWDKVNLDDQIILVDSSWDRKGDFKDTKSGDDRMVEIADGLLVLLKKLKLENDDSHFVLPRIREWDMGDQARHLRQFLSGIGLPEVRFHDLRATWATMLLSKGVPPIKVMAMGGWKDIKTMQYYVRLAGVEIKGITKCLTFHDPSKRTAKILDFGSRS